MKEHVRTKTRKICFLGLLGAVAIALSYLESFIVLPGLLPGVKLGLSNIVVMYCLFFLDGKSAFVLASLKSAFVLLMRGPTAALLSAMGGWLSVAVMFVCLRVFSKSFSYYSLSILGAVAHNLAQLLGACLLTGTWLSFYYFPVLLVSGLAAGILTGVLLHTVLPAMQRVSPYFLSQKN